MRLRKEARELLPVLAGTVVLMAAPGLFWHKNNEALAPLAIFVFGLGCAVMGAAVFGSEFQHKTVGLLLAQPVRRSVLWGEKMAVLGTGLVVTFGALLVCLAVGYPGRTVPPNLVLGLALVPLCAFCGAPCMTLAARSGLAGMVFATVLPAGLAVVTAAATERWLPRLDSEWVVVATLCVYCAVVYWRGYCRFRNLEFKAGSGGEIALPAAIEGLLTRGLGWAAPASAGPWASLLKKEFRLQQISFVVAAVFCGLGLLASILHWANTTWADGLLVGEYILYLLILPFMVGAMAVAEERTLGIAEWHLTLPVSARKQWWAKLSVSGLTSLVLGLLLPGLLFLAAAVLFNLPARKEFFSDATGVIVISLFLVLATSLAAYTASVSGSTVRAILQAFGLVVVGGGVVALTVSGMQFCGQAWGYDVNPSERLLQVLACAGAVLITSLLQWLAFRNFRRCGVSVAGSAIQLVGLLLSVALLVVVLFWTPLFWHLK